MVRKNIFEIMESRLDFGQEVERLFALLNGDKAITLYKESYVETSQMIRTIGIIEFVDIYAFKTWKGRGTCIDIEDMLEVIGIYDMFDSKDFCKDNILIFAEFAANILYLAERITLNKGYSYRFLDTFVAAKENLSSLLGWLNCERKIFETQEKVLVVEANEGVTAAAEILEEDLAFQVVKYNHNTLKGDIDSKKNILLALGAELEPRRKKIAEINKELEDNIFFMLNNMNLRHNNRSKNDKNYKTMVANMRKSKLEEWYDELYQMIILAILELEQVDRNVRVSELKKNITKKDVEKK